MDFYETLKTTQRVVIGRFTIQYTKNIEDIVEEVVNELVNKIVELNLKK